MYHGPNHIFIGYFVHELYVFECIRVTSAVFMFNKTFFINFAAKGLIKPKTLYNYLFDYLKLYFQVTSKS